MGFTMVSVVHGSLERDAGFGDGREDPPRVFRSEEADQGDLPRTESFAEGRAKGSAVGATEFHYERGEQPLPRIGPWQDALDQLLASNEAKPGRERLTLIRIFEALRGLGYEGGYDAVRRYARVWQRDRAASAVGAFIPLSFAPGEAYQFDWRQPARCARTTMEENGGTCIIGAVARRLT